MSLLSKKIPIALYQVQEIAFLTLGVIEDWVQNPFLTPIGVNTSG